MKITRRSPVTKEYRTMDIDVTDEQLQMWADGMLIQQAMPHLTSSEREFIMTGCTDADWNEMLGDTDAT